MYHLHVTVSEGVAGWVCRASLSDIEDSGASTLVATHGPLLATREDEGESDLAAALRVARTYLSYVDTRHQITSGVAPFKKTEKG